MTTRNLENSTVRHISDVVDGNPATAHHMKIISAYTQVVGNQPKVDGLTATDVREMILSLAKEDKAHAKAAQKAAKGPKVVKQMTLEQVRDRGGNWDLVRGITTFGKKGQPTRVDMECVVCGSEHNRASQDVFQTRTCSASCKKALGKQENNNSNG